MSSQTITISVQDLRLDPENPRLPASKIGLSQPELISYYYYHASVQELIDSMLENGFFPHEPLIVAPQSEAGDYVVWEGNRRLTALKIINGDDCDENIPKPLLGESVPENLRAVPATVVESYDEVRTFIGYRHITGLKTWPPEAKARFILKEVEKAVESGEADPLKAVGRVIGSNSAGVKTHLLPILALAKAEEGKADTVEVRADRFGVWERLWSSGGFRAYLEVPTTGNYQEIVEAVENLDVKKLSQVVLDLSTGPDGKRLVKDSRVLDKYGKILANPIANQVLRETNDLMTAAQVVESEVLVERFETVLKRLRALQSEVDLAEIEDLSDPALLKISKLIRSVALSIFSVVDESKVE